MKVNKMGKKIIILESQLREYVERKKAEKTFGSILFDMHQNSKNLNENISLNKANQMIIESYRRKNLITPHVEKLLKEYSIINDNGEII